jgi:RNA-binding protein Musashi
MLLTGPDSLKDYFSQFGEVSECTVMRDAATGRSRGFGFLTFRDPKCVNTVMVKEHYLDGKIVRISTTSTNHLLTTADRP